MTTNIELTQQVKQLQETVTRLQASNNRMRDDIEQLKSNHGRLVEGVNKNIESMVSRFQGPSKAKA
jgi:cell division protein FtsB